MDKSYKTRAEFNAAVEAYLGTSTVFLDGTQVRAGSADHAKYETRLDGSVYLIDATPKKAVPTKSITLSQTAIDELAAFAAMPRIVAASLTGPTKLELVKALEPQVTKPAPPVATKPILTPPPKPATKAA